MNTKKNAGYAGSTPAEKQARGLRTEAARQQQQAVARGIPVIVDITAAPVYPTVMKCFRTLTLSMTTKRIVLLRKAPKQTRRRCT